MHNLLVFQALAVALASGDGSVPSIVIESDPSATPIAKHAGIEVPRHVRPSERIGQEDILGKLEVQNAIRVARQNLDAGLVADAVRQLESCVDRAGGSGDFLASLESAYRAQLSELVGQGKSKEASIVARKLRSLGVDPNPIQRSPAVATPEPSRPESMNVAQAIATETEEPAVAEEADEGFAAPVKRLGQTVSDSVRSLIPRAKSAPKEEKTLEVRGKMAETEPLTAAVSHTSNIESGCPELVEASALFASKRYQDALVAYEKAYQADPVSVQTQRARWGYCLLYSTIDRYNTLIEGDLGQISASTWRDLKADAETAKRLAPSIPYTDKVVAAIGQRLEESIARTRPAAPAVPITPQKSGSSGVSVADIGFQHRASADQRWHASETKNFVIYHRDPRLAEEVGLIVEQARKYAYDLWFPGEPQTEWTPKCEVFLYPTAQEYGVSTGVGPQSPGHSKVSNSGGQILSRTVLVRIDDPAVMDAVLPHEVAHVVFAGRFGAHTLPRWADEGMAVLTEPLEKQNAHLVNLSRCQLTGRGFSCAEVMTMGQYPAGEAMRDFYAHSVGICRFLVERHGHQKLVAFLRQALDSRDYESALAQVYGISGFAQVEAEFRGYVASIGNGTVASAQ